MKLKTYISTIVFLIIFIFSLSAPTLAQTPTSTESLISQLQQQIKLLMAQVEELKTQIAEVKTELKLTRSLFRGLTGDDVKQLQTFLKQKYPDFYSGPITGYFGPLTESAIKKLQEKEGIESIGVVGPKTTARLNELITEGAGKSDNIPKGLLIAPGIEKKISTTTPSATATPTPNTVGIGAP
ncbi:MAG: peptidoglycan-binding domain 1 protein, partial [Microgenomates group bacterium Gr01-1014_80]